MNTESAATTDAELIARFKREVEREWRNPQVTAAYRKWDREESEWGRAAREFIIDRARLSPGHSVLDIGSAHGEPGIAIAEVVGPEGHVTLLDIAPELLGIAAERARREGLQNVTTVTADAHDLPFPDASFDRITSRLAAMYFADAQRAFREALRVLKPGGRATYLVWGTYEQPMFQDILGLLFKYVTPPDEHPDAPSPFTYSEPGKLSRTLEMAGFRSVQEEQATLPTTFPGRPERWWEWMLGTAGPVQSWLDALPHAVRQEALSEIYDALRVYYDGQRVNVPITVIVVSGLKPS